MAEDEAKKTFKEGLGEKAEKALAFLTILNTLHDIYDSVFKIHEKLPEEHKRILRLWFGLTRKDEELFNQDLSKLGINEQILWGKFLAKCKDFQRSQIILLVAGMNADYGKAKTTETTGEGKEKKTRITDAMPPVNERLAFITSFAKLLSEKYEDNIEEAIEHALNRKLIMENPAHQKILDAWSAGSSWFKETILEPIGAVSLKDFVEKATAKVNSEVDKIEDFRKERHPSKKGFLARFLTQRK